MSFNQMVILDYSPELLELLEDWVSAPIDIGFDHIGPIIVVRYNDPSIIFILGRAYQNKTLITLANTKD